MGKSREWLTFIAVLYIPFLVGATIIGAITGYIGRHLALRLGVHTTDKEGHLLFISFLVIGAVMGIVGSTKALIAFVRAAPNKSGSVKKSWRSF